MVGLEGTSFEHYRLQGILGRGGMSEVYLALNEQTGEEVACKVVSGTNAIYLERFRREAEVIDRLQHPHILPALDYGDQGPWHYLIMPYVSGGTLSDYLQDGPMPLEQVSELLDQIASALQFAHDHGVLHRDIKPSNILMRDDNYSYLSDFGLVKNLEGGDTLTQTGMLLGTPEYMSPDLADGPATALSDIYALGIMVYQMVSGYVPFTGETPIAIYWKHIRDLPASPSLLNPALSPAIDRVLMRAIEKDPAQRYQRAEDFASIFRQAVYQPELFEPAPVALVGEQQAAIDELIGRDVASPVVATPGPDRRRFFYRRPLRDERPPRLRRLRRSRVSGETPVEKRTPASLPPLPQRRRKRTMTSVPDLSLEEIEQPAPPKKLLPTKRSKHLRHLRVGIVVIGLLLLIVLPLGYVYSIYNTQRPVLLKNANATAEAQATAQTQATLAAATLRDAVSREQVLPDPMTQNTGKRWAEDTANCTFTGDSYRVIANQVGALQACSLLTQQFSDGTVQVEVTLVDSGGAGVMLRANGEQYYDFEITKQGQYVFRRHDPGQGNIYVDLLPLQTSSAILSGLQHNTLTIIARGDDFQFFINDTFVGEARDATYSVGRIALTSTAQTTLTSGTSSFANFTIFK